GAGFRLPDVPLVDVLDGESTAQHLDKHLAELLGGQVVEERVQHGAEVEEGVRDGVQDDVAPEVRHVPVHLAPGRRHEAPDLVGHPAGGQTADDQP
ncbi:hypothetical protein GN956_G21604, partial [Arapaima gigas]